MAGTDENVNKKEALKKELCGQFVTHDHLRSWAICSIDDDLESTRGIGKGTAEKLRANGIKTTTALIGQFLMCKTSEDMTTQDLANEFYWYLRDIGIEGYRGVIVRYIGFKANTMVPGIFRERDLMKKTEN